MIRGREIASHTETIEKIGEDEWSVPSQTGFGRNRVWFVGDLGRCSCPDYAKRTGEAVPAPCKHLFAVIDLRLKDSGQSLVAPERKPRRQYAQHPAYTKGQTAEMRLLDSLLHDVGADVPDPPTVVGREANRRFLSWTPCTARSSRSTRGLRAVTLAGSTRTPRTGISWRASPATTSPPVQSTARRRPPSSTDSSN